MNQGDCQLRVIIMFQCRLPNYNKYATLVFREVDTAYVGAGDIGKRPTFYSILS